MNRKSNDSIHDRLRSDEDRTAGRQGPKFLFHRGVGPFAQEDRVGFEPRSLEQDEEIAATLDDEVVMISDQLRVFEVLVFRDPWIFEIVYPVNFHRASEAHHGRHANSAHLGPEKGPPHRSRGRQGSGPSKKLTD